MARLEGFEPSTLEVEIPCSIQLNYKRLGRCGKIRTYNLPVRSQVLYPVDATQRFKLASAAFLNKAGHDNVPYKIIWRYWKGSNLRNLSVLRISSPLHCHSATIPWRMERDSNPHVVFQSPRFSRPLPLPRIFRLIHPQTQLSPYEDRELE